MHHNLALDKSHLKATKEGSNRSNFLQQSLIKSIVDPKAFKWLLIHV